MSHTQKRKALLLCSPFFGYYKHIMNQLSIEGYDVDYYNDRPSENPWIKGFIKLNQKFLNPLIRNYYDRIINETKTKDYDFVLVINNKVLTRRIIHKFKKHHNNARFVFYTWDSIKLYPNTVETLECFDKAYSFDVSDCKMIPNLIHLPLFYIKIYEDIATASANIPYEKRNYDIISVCTAHPNRYKMITRLIPELKALGLKIYSFMFIEPLQYAFNKIFDKEFKHARRCEFNSRVLPESEMITLFKETKAVLDIQHSNQTGLTMRTFETLGAKRKLITYNAVIKTYDFYDENNIFILDDHNWREIPSFLESDYKEIDETIYKRYSIESWTKTILEDSTYLRFKK